MTIKRLIEIPFHRVAATFSYFYRNHVRLNNMVRWNISNPSHPLSTACTSLYNLCAISLTKGNYIAWGQLLFYWKIQCLPSRAISTIWCILEAASWNLTVFLCWDNGQASHSELSLDGEGSTAEKATDLLAKQKRCFAISEIISCYSIIHSIFRRIWRYTGFPIKFAHFFYQIYCMFW